MLIRWHKHIGILLEILVLLLTLILTETYEESSKKIKVISSHVKKCLVNTPLKSQENKVIQQDCGKDLHILLEINGPISKDTIINLTNVTIDKDVSYVHLHEPLILRIHQSSTRLSYPLSFIQKVNNLAHEVFYHVENTENYKGCNEEVVDEFCSETNIDTSLFEDEEIKGFCCSCEGSDFHARSGQDCTHHETTPSSTHCLKLDNLWYKVYLLDAPTLMANIFVSSFIKTDSGLKRVAENQPQRLSLKRPIASDMFIRYELTNEIEKTDDPLESQMNVLLIPDRSSVQLFNVPLQLQENASTYMIVHKNMLKLSGKVCDRIGVSYQAFVQQKDRCKKQAQSCLNNQPMHLWLHDKQRQLQGLPTSYFLSGFFNISSPEVIYNKEQDKMFLVGDYNKPLKLVMTVSIDKLSSYFSESTQKSSTDLDSFYSKSLDSSECIMAISNFNVSGMIASCVSQIVDIQNPAEYWASVVILLVSILGTSKAIFGICFPQTVGQFGWCLFFKARGKHSRKKIYFTKWELFLLNLIFGIYLPFIWLHLVLHICFMREKKSQCRSQFDDSFVAGSPINTKNGGVLERKFEQNLANSDSEAESSNSQAINDKSYKARKTTSPGRKGRFGNKLENHRIIQAFMSANPVYANFVESKHCLKNCGESFSLCGRLVKERRRYKFVLDEYKTQTAENVSGYARLLDTPSQIEDPEKFEFFIIASEIQSLISIKPYYPCLNSKLRNEF